MRKREKEGLWSSEASWSNAQVFKLTEKPAAEKLEISTNLRHASSIDNAAGVTGNSAARKFCSCCNNFLGNYAARIGIISEEIMPQLGNFAAPPRQDKLHFLLAFLSLDKTGTLHRAKIQVWWDLSSSFCGGECHPESRTRSARLSFRRDLTSSQRHFCHARRCFGKFCLPSPPRQKKS